MIMYYKLFLNKFLHKIFTPKVLKQIWLLILFLSCFYISASYFLLEKGVKLSTFHWIKISLLLGVLIIGGIYLFGSYFKKNLDWKNWGVKKNIPVFLLLLICLAMRIPMLDNLPRWDAGEYYYTLGTVCQNFDFTFESFWKFRIAGHPTLAFAFFASIGEFLNPRGVLGVLIVNLTGTMFAIFFIYKLYIKWIKNCSKWKSAFLTFIVSITPLFYGTFSYINVDYFMTIFFIFMVYAAAENHYILLTFFAVCTSQTKEPGVLLVGGFFFVHLIKSMCNGRSLRERVQHALCDGVNWSAVFTGAIYILYVIRQGALVTWGTSLGGLVKGKEEITMAGKYNGFGFVPEYIIFKLKQFFVLNFSWISMILLILSVITLIHYYYKYSNMNDFKHLISCFEIWGALIMFILFGSLYVTATLSRYNIVIAVLLTFLALLLFETTIGRKLSNNIQIIGGAILSVLLITQTFTTIDNVSNRLFATVDTGRRKMLYTDFSQSYFGDGLINNYQYNWIDDALNKMLSSVEYDKNTLIINYRSMGAGSHISGNGKVYIVNWDTQAEKRTFIETSQKSSNVIPIKSISYVPEMIKGSSLEELYMQQYKEKLPEKAVIYFITYYGENEEQALLDLADIYQVVSKESACVRGGSIIYYSLIRK